MEHHTEHETDAKIAATDMTKASLRKFSTEELISYCNRLCPNRPTTLTEFQQYFPVMREAYRRNPTDADLNDVYGRIRSARVWKLSAFPEASIIGALEYIADGNWEASCGDLELLTRSLIQELEFRMEDDGESISEQIQRHADTDDWIANAVNMLTIYRGTRTMLDRREYEEFAILISSNFDHELPAYEYREDN
jgi:hypothetical protein